MNERNYLAILIRASFFYRAIKGGELDQDNKYEIDQNKQENLGLFLLNQIAFEVEHFRVGKYNNISFLVTAHRIKEEKD